MFDWIAQILDRVGILGIALLMFLENIFPPIPSELIMPLAGFAAARGEQSLWAVIASGTVGSLAGAGFWYWVGKRFGRGGVLRLAEKHGRWLTLCPSDVTRAIGRFDQHGSLAVLVGRLIPTVRTLISVPAGIAQMNIARFLMFSALGTAVWTAALAVGGYVLGQHYSLVAAYISPASNGIIVLLAVWYFYRVIRFKRTSAD